MSTLTPREHGIHGYGPTGGEPTTPVGPVSPPGSMVGWSWRVWFAKQKDDLKKIVSYGTGILVAGLGVIVIPPGAWWSGLLIIAGIAVSLLSRLLMDRLDYWLTDDPGQEERVQAALVKLLTTPKVGEEKGEPQ